MARRLFALIRSLIVAPLFVSLWLYFLPRWFAGRHAFDDPQPLAWIIVAVGALIGVPCVLAFAWRGLGTPAPFDPPRRLVVSGPYRWVRNPMYVGMGIAMLGEALVFPHARRVLLSEMLIAFILVLILTVVYEEPGLRRTFGADYDQYARDARRWFARLTPWSATMHVSPVLGS